jgi:hypothetical protein
MAGPGLSCGQAKDLFKAASSGAALQCPTALEPLCGDRFFGAVRAYPGAQ